MRGLAQLTALALMLPATSTQLPPRTNPSTAVAAERTVSLSGAGWTLSNANGSVSVPAVVPGDAHAALAAAGMIGDIYYRFNDLALSWVANESWAWSRKLPALPGSCEGHCAWALVCEGLQTIGTVTLGGQVLGHVNNQYRRWEFPLPAGSGGQELRLAFRSISGLAPTALNATTQSVRQEYLSWGKNGIEDYVDMTGAFPQGPWLPVYLVWTSNTLPLITAVVPHVFSCGGKYPDTALTDDFNAFTVNTTVHLRTVAPGVRGVLRVSGDWAGSATVWRSVVFAEAGDHALSLVLDASNVRLWWPNTWGEPHRYTLNASFTPHTRCVVCSQSAGLLQT